MKRQTAIPLAYSALTILSMMVSIPPPTSGFIAAWMLLIAGIAGWKLGQWTL